MARHGKAIGGIDKSQRNADTHPVTDPVDRGAAVAERHPERPLDVRLAGRDICPRCGDERQQLPYGDVYVCEPCEASSVGPNTEPPAGMAAMVVLDEAPEGAEPIPYRVWATAQKMWADDPPLVEAWRLQAEVVKGTDAAVPS